MCFRPYLLSPSQESYNLGDSVSPEYLISFQTHQLLQLVNIKKIVFSFQKKKGGNSVIWDNMDEPGGHCAK